jgi:hypothetical protein
MRRLRARTRAGALAALGCLMVLLGVVLFGQASSPVPASHEVTQPVYFAYGIVFSPKPVPSDVQYLTADEAWMKWEHGEHLTPDIRTEFGMLNDQGRNPVAWGFSQRGCMVPPGYPTKRQVALASSPKCREWTFLNPKTGRQILTTDVYPTKP